MAIDFGKAIKAINPDAEFVIYGDDVYEDINWLNGTTPISKADIEAKQAELEVTTAHIYPRANDFQYKLPIAEQLDKLFHDIDNGTLDKTGEFYTAIKKVKDDNPKSGG
tara:strand:- start:119 stop:445 length:327 start_codon:yes stop_codon:yes gene_type:complete